MNNNTIKLKLKNGENVDVKMRSKYRNDFNFCNKWQELGAGEEHCYSVYRKKRGAKYRLFNADGSMHATAFPK